MKKEFWAISLLGAILVTQIIPQKMYVNAERNMETGVLLEDLVEEENSDSGVESIETFMYDVNAELAELEENYIDRFIIKYKADAVKRNMPQITAATEKAYSKAKVVKEGMEAEYMQKIMDVSGSFVELAQTMSLLNEKSDKEISDISITSVCGQETPYQVIALPESIDPDLFLAEMERALPKEIQYIQPDYIMELSGEENILNTEIEDGILPDHQGELDEETQNIIIPNKKSDLQKAWEISTGEGITVALIDTGVDITHPMLEEHIVDGYDFYNGKENVYDEKLGMEQTHGTHIAGIIAQTAPNAKIIPLKVFENGKAYTSDIIKAIEYAEEKGTSIVNMSFGCASYNTVLKEIMEQSKIFFVCAAGNSRINIDLKPIYPASFGLNNQISVAALNSDLGMSFFSNYGTGCVDISAWGRDVCSAYPGGEHGTMDGTSMAAGYISGAAALVMATNKETDLKKILKDSADKLSCLENKVCSGNKINFYDAVSGNTNKELVMVETEDDFDVLGLQATPEENWELFNTMANVQISSDGYHTIVLKRDGSVWAWGKNQYGQLGDGTTEDSFTPKRILGLADIIQVVAGEGTTFALRSDGTVYACGYNNQGRLGDGTVINKTLPVKINGLHNITAIDAYGVSMALGEDGTIWTWGNNNHGQLGNGTNVSSSVPVIVSDLTGATQIAAGSQHCLAVAEDGTLYSWGYNGDYRLGDGTSVDRWRPVQVMNIGKMKASANPRTQKTIIARSHNLVIEEGGSIWAWGYDRNGQLGNGQFKNETLPTMIDRLGWGVAVAASDEHSIVLLHNGRIYAWGQNTCGELGNGTTTTTPFYQYIMDGFNTDCSIAAGNGRSYVIDSSGMIYHWGLGLDGQTKILTPQKMEGVLNTTNTYFDKAIKIHTLNYGYQGYAGEANQYYYYSFQAPYTTTYTFESISNLDMYGQLYDSGKNILTANDDGGCKGESKNRQDFYFKYELQANQTYFISLKAFSSSTLGDYALKVKYYDDYGDNVDNASPILLEESIEGKINYPDDVDFFKFVPNETTSYIFYTTEAGSVSGTLYDHNIAIINKSSIVSSDDKSNMMMKATLVAGRSYYIKTGKGDEAWSNNDKYVLHIKKNKFEGTVGLGNRVCVRAKMQNKKGISKFGIKIMNSEKLVLMKRDNVALNSTGELEVSLAGLLEKGNYRILILADHEACKVIDIEVLGKEEQKFVSCDDAAEVLIPYVVSGPFNIDETFFSLGYEGYQLVDVCDATKGLETGKGLISGAKINVLDVQNDYVLFQSTDQSASNMNNAIKLKCEGVSPSFVCYAYRVY